MKRKPLSWKKIAKLINRRRPVYKTVAHGCIRSLSGAEVWIDCGNDLGDIGLVKITFRTQETANEVYCNLARIDLKVVHPRKIK